MKLRKSHRVRIVALGALFIALGGVVAGRLVTLQVVRHDDYSERAKRQHFRRVTIQPERGDILDRAGRPLAQSTGRMTVYVSPKYFADPAVEASVGPMLMEVANLTGERYEKLRDRLKGDLPTALVKRIRPEVADRVLDVFEGHDVDGRGYWLHRESIRLYPRHLAAPVIGFCSTDGDGDNKGIAGLELQYDKELGGKKIASTSPRSGISETLQPVEPDDLLAARGNSLILTIDANIQEATEEALLRTISERSADAGGAIVMETQTGAILAMASAPTFDNNKFKTARAEAMRNRIITDPFETGSVVKLFTAAMLMDHGLVTPDTLVDCEGGFAVVDGRRLRDAPGHAPLHVVPFSEAMRYSSNVGIVKAGILMKDNQEWYNTLRNFGFGQHTGVDLPGEGRGILYPVEKWTRLSRTSLPMGYETSLTSMQIAAGISAVSNGGSYFKPHIVKEIRDSRGNVVYTHTPEVLRQVVRPTTSALLRDLMEEVVADGTAKKAQIPGYRIGGKTGTTRKSDVFDRREYIASFVGVLPIDNPQITIYVYVDNPKGEYYAGIVAAPVFKEIAQAATLHLGIAPSETLIGEIEEKTEIAKADAVEVIDGAEIAALPAPGSLPDFKGMTMGQVRRVLPDSVSKVRFLGTGYVSDQFPPAGDIVDAKTELVLHFSPANQDTNSPQGATP